jgi:hypothetical protein
MTATSPPSANPATPNSPASKTKHASEQPNSTPPAPGRRTRSNVSSDSHGHPRPVPPPQSDRTFESNVDATWRELEELPNGLGRSATARMALEMALQLDSRCSAAQKAMCALRHYEAMLWLRSRVPPAQEGDFVDELRERRRRRLGGRSGA